MSCKRLSLNLIVFLFNQIYSQNCPVRRAFIIKGDDVIFKGVNEGLPVFFAEGEGIVETHWTVSGGVGTGTPDEKSGCKCGWWCQ